jgi:hypothetical protein
VKFGAGRADAVRVELDRCPQAMQDEVRAWRERFPRSAALIERLYADFR